MHSAVSSAQSNDRPWRRRRASGDHHQSFDPEHEPLWARRTKWTLLALAVALAAWTGFELVRTLAVLAESPVSIITSLPPLALAEEAEPPPECTGAKAPNQEIPSVVQEPAMQSTPAEGAQRSGEALLAEELKLLRKALETRPRLTAHRQSATPKAPPRAPSLLPGIALAEAPARSTARKRRPENSLRVVSGPRVRLIGGDALVEALVENRLASKFERAVALELLVDGKQRQRRRLRLRIPAGARLHLSERFSTTLPDGTYSARLIVPPFG